MSDSFRTRKSLQAGARTFEVNSIAALKGHDASRLPFSLKVLLENLLRFEEA
jgi:aconitate hydratase